MPNPNKIIDYFLAAKELNRKFCEWLVMPFSSKEKDAALRKSWNAIDSAADHKTQQAYDKICARLGLNRTPVQIEMPPATRKISWSFSAIAAAAMFPLLIGLGGYVLLTERPEQQPELAMIECFAPVSEMRKITLCDSTVVNLNAGSILLYPAKFGDTREVYLNGEASFSVTHDKARRFLVKTADMNIEVLGTVFNVSSYADSRLCSATTRSGTVRVRLNGSDSTSYIVTADQQVLFDRQTSSSRKQLVKADDAFLWESGGMLFEQSPISEIKKVIERKYGVNVYLSSSKYDKAIITAKFRSEVSLEEFLSILHELVNGLDYRIADKNVYIY